VLPLHALTACLLSRGCFARVQVFCHRPDPRTPIEETVRGSYIPTAETRGLQAEWKRNRVAKISSGQQYISEYRNNQWVRAVAGMNNLIDRGLVFYWGYVDLKIRCIHRKTPASYQDRLTTQPRIYNMLAWDLTLTSLSKCWWLGVRTSEWTAQMIQEARDVANRLGLVPPFFDQTQYNMLHRERIEVEYGPLYPGE
jgi:hypothetical protein